MVRWKRKKLVWSKSNILQKKVKWLAQACSLTHIRSHRVLCYESTGAKTRAHARIWGLSRVWQEALSLEPAYILEVISEKFNRLNKAEQDHVLIHELLHIPKNFSGALVPHKRKGGVSDKVVRELYLKIKR